MAEVKWIKITTDIFDDDKIKIIDRMPARDEILVIWFKLLALAGKVNNGGLLFLNNRIAYTSGYESCGKLTDHPAYGITKSGAKVQENHTIATDWSVLPKGTKVMIEGFPYVYTVEDVGGAIKGNKIDIYMESLTDAREFGRQKLKVWVVE